MPKQKQSEHEIQSAILDWLKHKHIFHWRNNTGAMKGSHKGKSWYVKFGTPGAPDIFAIIEGKLWGIEVKAPGGKLSDKQQEFSDGMRVAGAYYLVAHSLECVTGVIHL